MGLTLREEEEIRKKLLSTGLTEPHIREAIARKAQWIDSAQQAPVSDVPVVTKETQAPKEDKGLMEKVMGLLAPRITQFVKDIVGTISLKGEVKSVDKKNLDLFKKSRELTEQAKKESDPVKKAELLEQSRKLSEQIQGNVERMQTEYQQQTGIDINKPYEEQRGSYGAQALGVAGEAASWLLPATKVIRGTGLVAKIVNTAATGAKIGFVYGATKPQDINLGERVKEGLTSAAFGATTNTVLTGATEAIKTPIKNFVSSNASRIYRLFRVTPSEMAQFRKSSQNMDFAEEIFRRDAKNMAGKTYQELMDYFTQRWNEAMQDVDDLLAQRKETVDRKLIENKIKEMRKSLAAKYGNVGQGGAVSALGRILTDLKKSPEKLSLVQTNRIKRQLQDLGSSYFSVTGHPSSISEQLAKLSSFVKELIEEVAPEVKEKNAVVQLYHLAKTSIARTSDREANKLSNDLVAKFLQTLPAAIGLGAGFYTGNPYNGFYGFLGASILSGALGAGRVKYFTPEFQTRLISVIEPIARSQGLKNSDKIATNIVRQLGNIITRQVNKGTETTSESSLYMPSVENMDTSGYIPPQGFTQDSSEFVRIQNERTGEIRTIHRSELADYGLDDRSVNGIPSKEDILAAMFFDIEQTGGKNISTLNTLLNAYDKVTSEGLSATDKTVVADAAGALNLLGEIEASFNELQNLGVAARSGGLIERGRAAFEGNLVALTQEGTRGAAAAAYANTVDAFLSRLSRAVGEKGVLTDFDIKRIRKSIPTFSTSPEAAARQFAIIRTIISSAIESRIKTGSAQ